MSQNQTNHDEWWRVVQAVAGFVAFGYDIWGDEVHIRNELKTAGHTPEAIQAGFDWIEGASASGCLTDVLDMLQPSAFGTRVPSPLERVYMSDELWELLEDCRSKGIIGNGLAERIVEGIRALDTRDWEDDEVRAFIADVVTFTSPPSGKNKRARKLIKGSLPDFYS